MWKRLVKAGVVQDEEVAEQLAKPAQGIPRRPKVNNITIAADRESVANTICENFDASRLTGAQLASIAASLEKLGLSRGSKAARGAPPRRRAPAPTQPSASESDATDEDDGLTETTAAEESDAPVRSSKGGDTIRIARQVSERLAASKPTPASEPQSPPMARRRYGARRGMD